jgi:hypothetical protein
MKLLDDIVATATDGQSQPAVISVGPLLRHTVSVGLREDKPAQEVRREVATRP